MREIDLIAIVLELVPLINKPVKAANWYGKATQSLFYECLRAYDESYACQVHALGEERVPFTTSTLMGKFDHSSIQPGMRYYLRFTGLNELIENILYASIQPGGYFSIGTIMEIVNVPFSVENIYWENHDHGMSCYSSYRILQDYFLYNHQADGNRLRFSFEHFPVIMQNGAHYNPILTPDMLFGSLLRKWNNHAGYTLPTSVLDFAEREVYVSSFKMESQPVQQEGLVLGSRGYLQVETKRSRESAWAVLQMLAAYAFYSGVGKDTARGFGMVRIE